MLPVEAEAQVTAGTSVRVVDISLGGVLLISSRPAYVGTLGRLSLTVGNSPLTAEVEIRRVSALGNGHGYRLGARFTDLVPESLATIARFVGQA